ncbi:MAG: aminopeptidase [Bacteroidales bacterium]|nr:aminopeptidase [Bacteroidales bacterium]
MRKSIFLILLIQLSCVIYIKAQEVKKVGGYNFTTIKEIKHTPVKNQASSGTCWSFSGISFIESELMRMGKGEFELSEMFVVRMAYKDKAAEYVRWQGAKNFGGGGAFHDVTNVIKKYGILPDEAYTGLVIGEKKHNHNEMDAVLKAVVSQLIRNLNRKLSPVWPQAIDGILDAYLGKIPENFIYKGKNYTPRSFTNELGINPDDYVEITSYTHHPFYSKFIIEVPDNWSGDEVYNVPLAEFKEILDYAIMNGYGIGWGSDVSDEGFSFKNGVAIVPEKNWEDIEKAEKDTIFKHPVKQKEITQEFRQKGYDNYTLSDDHGMHIVGIAKDQLGQKYYKVKNSWDTKSNDFGGYFYASEAFVLGLTMDIMIHKDALPKNIAKKLGIK